MFMKRKNINSLIFLEVFRKNENTEVYVKLYNIPGFVCSTRHGRDHSTFILIHKNILN